MDVAYDFRVNISSPEHRLHSSCFAGVKPVNNESCVVVSNRSPIVQLIVHEMS